MKPAPKPSAEAAASAAAAGVEIGMDAVRADAATAGKSVPKGTLSPRELMPLRLGIPPRAEPSGQIEQPADRASDSARKQLRACRTVTKSDAKRACEGPLHAQFCSLPGLYSSSP